MLQSILYGLLAVSSPLFDMITLLILLSVVLSWVNADPYNPYVQLTRRLTEPVYRPLRGFTQRFSGPFDLAPLCAIFIMIFCKAVLQQLLRLGIQFVS